VVSAAFVIALLFVAVGTHVLLAQNQFRLDRLDKQAADQEAKYQQLRLQVDQLSSPQAIVGAAEGRLGMVPAQSVTFLTPSSAASGSSASGTAGGSAGAAAAGTAPADGGSGGPAPATAPPGWSTIKPQLADNP
jgi:cell division protein FtsL